MPDIYIYIYIYIIPTLCPLKMYTTFAPTSPIDPPVLYPSKREHTPAHLFLSSSSPDPVFVNRDAGVAADQDGLDGALIQPVITGEHEHLCVCV
jgi:hypothetical protein